ncbi:amino acid/polyamine/organocation transporter, APC superfamily [Belliella buryatensis]|uniref:Arginine/agmatine antiporter n=1 Tax=Belliella buryatensis TaxID=1500549 RepID=A0A239B219_9BACT|nr:APC family permease [Belliella buryatensis]SNS01671.1 amino acid/polyamine/organocation transporter, APC superfamily [Belliella buryatensis]
MENKRSLKRGIQRWDLVFLIINSVIGAGIFALPAKVFALSGVYSIAAFLVCALVMMVLILVFAEVSSRFERTGGPYLYVHQAFGPLPAFIIGWLLMLTRLFSYATLINLMVLYLSFFSEVFNEPVIRILIILSITGLITYFNWIGVKNTARVSNFLTIAKLFPLAVFILVGLFFIDFNNFQTGELPSLKDFSASTLLLIFAFGGFEAGLVNSGEIVEPKKNLPFGLMTAAAVIAGFYILIQFVSIGTLPDLANSDKPLADAATGFMGWWGGMFITIGAVVSIMGTLNVQILSGSRLPFALSEENQLPRFFGKIHPKFSTPWVSILFFASLVAFVAIFWGFMNSLAVSVISRLILYALVCASLIKLRKSAPKNSNFFKIPFGNYFAIAGILLTIWLLSGTQSEEIIDTLIWTGGGLLIFGLHHISKNKLG